MTKASHFGAGGLAFVRHSLALALALALAGVAESMDHLYYLNDVFGVSSAKP